MSNTREYRVIRPRMVDVTGGKRREFEVGEIVHLTDEQAAARIGKVELVVSESSRLDENIVELLQGAGYDTAESIKGAPDTDLLEIDGIGQGSLKKIRAFHAD